MKRLGLTIFVSLACLGVVRAGDDLDKIIAVLPSAVLRMQLAIDLVNHAKFEQATRVLQSVSAADRKAQTEISKQVFDALLAEKQFHAALTMMRETESDPSALPVAEKFSNAGFEEPIPQNDPRPFHWIINSRPQAQIGADSQAHSGAMSLRMLFRAANKLEAIPVTQTIIVEPDIGYRIQFFIRAQELVSGAPPIVTINDAVDGALLVASPPAEAGTYGWKLVTVDFKTKPKHDGITLSFARTTCVENAESCPIFGTVWYDDFNLQRVGAPGPATQRATNIAR